LDMSRTLRENAHRRNRERERNLKLECAWCAHCRGVNIINLNWQRPLWEGDQEVTKRSGWDKPMWFVIHTCMEATLGISLYRYLYLKLAKHYFFLIISYVFSSTKLENKRAEQVLPRSGEGGGPNNVYTCE
jgi:hypothetical protein